RRAPLRDRARRVRVRAPTRRTRVHRVPRRRQRPHRLALPDHPRTRRGGGVVSTRDIIDRARNLSTRQLDVPCGYPHQPADWIETVNALVAEVDQLRAQIAAVQALADRWTVAAADAADPPPSQL